MKTAIAHLKSVSPYGQGKYYKTEKLPEELHGDYEKRTWRDRCNVNAEGFLFIPPMAFKNCIAAIAKYRGQQIPGKGKSTYTKHFEAGVLVTEPLVLSVKKTEVEGEWLFVPADGKRGSGKRVEKCFPVVQSWEGKVTFYILDDIITKEVFEHHLEEAGKFIGLGRFRPQNNGFYGRFEVVDMEWIE